MTLEITHADDDQSVFVKFCLSVIKNKDESLYAHSLDTKFIASRLHQTLRINSELASSIDIGCLLHDIGKIAIPSHIVNKKGSYDNEEFRIMQKHTVLGHDIIIHLNKSIPPASLDIVLGHHEKNGGRGYPKQIPALPLHVEIAAVADISSAMQESRCYRPSCSVEASLHEVRKHHWSDTITDLLVNCPELFVLPNKNTPIPPTLSNKGEQIGRYHRDVVRMGVKNQSGPDRSESA